MIKTVSLEFVCGFGCRTPQSTGLTCSYACSASDARESWHRDRSYCGNRLRLTDPLSPQDSSQLFKVYIHEGAVDRGKERGRFVPTVSLRFGTFLMTDMTLTCCRRIRPSLHRAPPGDVAIREVRTRTGFHSNLALSVCLSIFDLRRLRCLPMLPWLRVLALG